MPDLSMSKSPQTRRPSPETYPMASTTPEVCAAPSQEEAAQLQSSLGNSGVMDLIRGDECREGGTPGTSAPPYSNEVLAAVEAGRPKTGLAALDASKPATQVDDQAVIAILQDLSAQVGGQGRAAVKAAWSKANGLRNTHPQDLNLAAAEHFLYSCGETEGLGSGIQMQVLTLGYEGVKSVLDVFGLRDVLSTDGSSPTPPSAAVMGWGMDGATKTCGDLE